MGVGAVGFAQAADVTDRKLPLRGAASATLPDHPELLGDDPMARPWYSVDQQTMVLVTSVGHQHLPGLLLQLPAADRAFAGVGEASA
ncbi:hypothetical protein ABZ328_28980 [Micromonospora aurantiaca]|uniref:hypothetical protein n=1 Tax=Micromonospora aurantiaca (nom. illeg.) TaxID=47850 RepID=UPI00340C1473